MTALRKAVAAERRKIRADLKDARKQVKDLEYEDRMATEVLAKLDGRATSPKPGGRRGRTRPHKYAKRGSRQAEILEHLRANPDRSFTPNDLAKALGMPKPSAAYAAKVLAERNGQVQRVVDPQDIDTLRVQYAETAVHPGEGVRT